MRTALAAPQRTLQLTLAVVKPDAMAHPLILQAVHRIIVENKFLIIRSKDLLWNRQQSQRFYQEHSDSATSASREIAFFFPEFSEEAWFRDEEPHLRREPGPDDPKAGVHLWPEYGRTETDG
uniref:Nucleoside diphosphate kinase-like domain-containing protein n=1 Tax=Anolis carolinensis TaxID=28377 RepID=A0A803SVK4_ANOCA